MCSVTRILLSVVLVASLAVFSACITIDGGESTSGVRDEPAEQSSPSDSGEESEHGDATSSVHKLVIDLEPVEGSFSVPNHPPIRPYGPSMEPTPAVMEYITREDPWVQEIVSQTLDSWWRWAYSDFEALQEWVANHIEYVSDQEVHGASDYWQLPAETLALRTGDCEDFAILLCALLRAYGVPEDEVYVAVGKSEYACHAYLVERWYTGDWRLIEPQAGVWGEFWFGDILLADYQTMWCFNDTTYFDGLPSLPPGEYSFNVGVSLWPVTRGASVEFLRYLGEGQRVTGQVQWRGTSEIVWGWSFNVYNPLHERIVSWSGTELQYGFDFTVPKAGIYRIEILKLDYLSRACEMTIDPPDWTKR